MTIQYESMSTAKREERVHCSSLQFCDVFACMHACYMNEYLCVWKAPKLPVLLCFKVNVHAPESTSIILRCFLQLEYLLLCKWNRVNRIVWKPCWFQCYFWHLKVCSSFDLWSGCVAVEWITCEQIKSLCHDLVVNWYHTLVHILEYLEY